MASQFQIERGIPVASAQPFKKKSKYPFADMQVGDSFLVPYNGRERTQLGANLATTAKKQLGKGNYRTARLADGIRVWRVA